MSYFMKNIFLLGVGSLAFSYEKADKKFNKLVERSQLSLRQDKKFNEELKRHTDILGPSRKNNLMDLNLASKDDIELVLNRLNSLEN